MAETTVRKSTSCKKPNAFELVTPNRVYIVYAETPQAMQDWIVALNKSAKQNRPMSPEVQSAKKKDRKGDEDGDRKSFKKCGDSWVVGTYERKKKPSEPNEDQNNSPRTKFGSLAEESSLEYSETQSTSEPGNNGASSSPPGSSSMDSPPAQVASPRSVCVSPRSSSHGATLVDTRKQADVHRRSGSAHNDAYSCQGNKLHNNSLHTLTWNLNPSLHIT